MKFLHVHPDKVAAKGENALLHSLQCSHLFNSYTLIPEPHSSVGSEQDLKTGRWFDSPTQPILFPRIEDSCCNRIDSSLNAVHCFDDGHVAKEPVDWEEYCTEDWLKEFQERIDRCTSWLPQYN